MNNIFIKSAEKKNNSIHLTCQKNIIISFPILNDDSKDLILNELFNENYEIINLKFLDMILDIFLKNDNRIIKISNY